MESNEQTELTSKRERDSLIESRLTALGLGRLRGVEGLSKKEKKVKKFMNIANSVGIPGDGGECVEVEEGMK